MSKLTTGSGSYPIPNRLTIAEWCNIARLDLTEPVYWPRALHLLTGAPYEELLKAPHKSLELGMGFCVHALSMRSRVSLTGWADLTFGEWVDLDIWLTWGIPAHLPEIIGILHPGCEWADEALYITEEYCKWRLSIYKSYSKLFGLNEPEEDPLPPDKLRVAKGWYRIMVKLAGGDLLKMELVAKQPVKAAFNMLAYMKEEDLKETQRQLEITRKYELQKNSRSFR